MEPRKCTFCKGKSIKSGFNKGLCWFSGGKGGEAVWKMVRPLNRARWGLSLNLVVRKVIRRLQVLSHKLYLSHLSTKSRPKVDKVSPKAS